MLGRLACAALVALCLAGTARAACRPYLNYAQQPPIARSLAFDPAGVPLVRYSFGLRRNPGTVADWGLQEYSFACHGRGPVHLRRALRAARWLLAHQARGGGWAYHFPWTEGPVTLRPPWISALAQGRAISLLVRAYATTGQRQYLRAARSALAPFQRTAMRGGVTDSWDGHPWYEEYPAGNANHVLNGYEFALIGLHDLAPYSPQAGRLFAAGVASLVWALPQFDGGPTGSYYAAGHFDPVTRGYLAVHVLLTRALYRMTGRARLRFYADAWAAILDAFAPVA